MLPGVIASLSLTTLYMSSLNCTMWIVQWIFDILFVWWNDFGWRGTVSSDHCREGLLCYVALWIVLVYKWLIVDWLLDIFTRSEIILSTRVHPIITNEGLFCCVELWIVLVYQWLIVHCMFDILSRSEMILSARDHLIITTEGLLCSVELWIVLVYQWLCTECLICLLIVKCLCQQGAVDLMITKEGLLWPWAYVEF
jgi:hypothetical protein